ncbi:ABC transporter permease [Halorussus marinus]|uniref:ABC transporter permease n=1 Tax=Halorussus marinus TaxID=2505976 RepID=UPI001092D048|nr:hypothetical protein [Halorussus marinus]
MRRAYHVARADFLQRVRSRRLIVVLAIVAFFGYLVNVGQIELAYQIGDGDSLKNIQGTNTAAFVGLKAGMTGSMVLLFAGFYLMKGTLNRDRVHDVDRLVASTAVPNRTYLLGKWVSNIGLGVVVLVTLALATVINHAVHGVGPTKPLALVGPVFVLALPLSALVGAVALLFETVDRLSGTLGNIGYFFLATFALAGLQSAEGRLPSELPFWVKSVDIMGHLAVYTLTADALLAVVPDASGILPSFGTLSGETQMFRYDGRPWPLWIYIQRAGLLLPAVITILVATIPFTRRPSDTGSEDSRWLSRLTTLLPAVGHSTDTNEDTSDRVPVDSMSLTNVEKRETWNFWRLVAAETRLTVRGQQWWWYIGAAAFVVAPVSILVGAGASTRSLELARRVLLPLAFVWPIFIWSELGVRVTKHRVADLVLSSNHPVKQLVAEWFAGVIVAAGVSSGLLTLFALSNQTGTLVGIASGVLFAPSLAVAMGMWSRSSWLFEMSYLLVWYIGPLNGATPMDFIGTTAGSVESGVPIVFTGLSVILLGAGLARRTIELRR